MKDNILCIFIMLFVSVTFNANAQKSPQGQFSVKGVLVDLISATLLSSHDTTVFLRFS